MQDRVISMLMRLMNSLSKNEKLEVLSMLIENLKSDCNAKDNSKDVLLDELSGAWMDTEDGLANEILNSRNSSKRDLSFN